MKSMSPQRSFIESIPQNLIDTSSDMLVTKEDSWDDQLSVGWWHVDTVPPSISGSNRVAQTELHLTVGIALWFPGSLHRWVNTWRIRIQFPIDSTCFHLSFKFLFSYSIGCYQLHYLTKDQKWFTPIFHQHNGIHEIAQHFQWRLRKIRRVWKEQNCFQSIEVTRFLTDVEGCL